MEFIRAFGQLGIHDVSSAGGKGASLGEMTRVGIPVPPGFVVLARAFDGFLDSNDLHAEIDSVLHTVKKEKMHTVEHAAEKIQALILGATMPNDIAAEIESNFKKLGVQHVAVRSSATAEDSASAAWAGQLDSFLNTEEKDVLKNVQRCWASLFTPRAIFYRFEKELHQQEISVAVVVQQMVQSECAGIAFSVHPVTEDYNQLIIEAAKGLGDKIVSGQVTPDSYVVEKEPRRIADATINQPAQVLSEAQILELSELILKMEKHYGTPQDIEWAYEGGKFYIVQSRPITTLSKEYSKDENNVPYFDKSNSVFTFESIGNSFLFEDIIVSYYMSWSSLTLGNDGNVRVYVQKDEVSRLNKIGAALTNQDMEKKKERVKETIKHIEHELPNFKIKEVLTKEDVVHVFQRLAELCKEYSYFDIHYSDGMWKSIEKDSEAKKNVDLIEKYKNEIRDKLNMPFFTQDGWLVTMVTKLSGQFGIPVETLNWYREEEILSLFDNKFVSEDTLEKRRLSYAFYIDKNGRRILHAGSLAKQFDNEFRIQTNVKTTKEIKGVVAHGGERKVQGVVKIIRRDYSNPKVARDCMDAMKEGNILVSETTDPELMDGLKKAGAIITDVGGMLSHAAITARELDTPCIIGTEIASKILKDGDLVEVDAQKGIVRILEKTHG